MATLTKEIILTTAEEVVEEIGMEKARVSDIAKRLGTSHAAIYKYFKNKDELFEALTRKWLLTAEAPVLDFATPEPGIQAVHDWLFLLAQVKHANFRRDPKMFKLYTDNVERSSTLSSWLFTRLWTKAEAALGVNSPDLATGRALVKAFTIFHNPALSFMWNDDTLAAEFAEVWALVEPGLAKLSEK